MILWCIDTTVSTPTIKSDSLNVGRASDHLKISHSISTPRVHLSIQPPVAPRFLPSGLCRYARYVHQYVSPSMHEYILWSSQFCRIATGPPCVATRIQPTTLSCYRLPTREMRTMGTAKNKHGVIPQCPSPLTTPNVLFKLNKTRQTVVARDKSFIIGIQSAKSSGFHSASTHY